MRHNLMKKGIILLFLCLCIPGMILAAQDSLTVIINEVAATPVEGEAAYTVTAYVTVVDDSGQPVTDLSAGNFSASQDGTEITLSNVAPVERPFSVMLVLDTSGSMSYQGKIDAVKEAAANFINGLSDDDEAGLIYFNDSVELAQSLSGDHQASLSIVGLLEARAGAGTCLYDAAYEAITAATNAPPGQRAIILLTDGIDETSDQSGPCSTHTVEDVINLATENATRVPIYTIGVGESRIDTAELQSIAEATGGTSLIAPQPGDVDALFGIIAGQLKNQYELTYRIETTSGEHNLTVTINNGSTTAVESRAFIAPELPPRLSVSGLNNGDLVGGIVKVRATLGGRGTISSVQFQVDGETVAEVSGTPFETELDSSTLDSGGHELTIIATLDDGTELREQIDFEIAEAAPDTSGGETAGGETEGAGAEGAAGSLNNLLLPIGIGVGVLVVAVVGVVLVTRRRKPEVRVAGSGAGAAASPTMLVAEDAFGELTIEESLSLQAGQKFQLRGALVRLGRGADNDVIVPDAPVSRNHAEIRKMPDGTYRAFDLGSTYGTFVDDQECGPAGVELPGTGTLRLGTRTIMAYRQLWKPQAAGLDDMTIDFIAEDDIKTEEIASPDAATAEIEDEDEIETLAPSGKMDEEYFEEDEATLPSNNFEEDDASTLLAEKEDDGSTVEVGEGSQAVEDDGSTMLVEQNNHDFDPDEATFLASGFEEDDGSTMLVESDDDDDETLSI